ncbi:MAG TPA: hypothetical protein VH143_16975 [Kofleriaceae bacterium]|jgi:hypothetical protein|nr:hypothetical protein [Kofleriaceae bacterium]
MTAGDPAVDLAALALDVRGRVPTLDAVLPDERNHRDDDTLLELATTYAESTARAACGAVLLISVVARLAFAALQHWLSHCTRQPGLKRYVLPSGDVYFGDRFDVNMWGHSVSSRLAELGNQYFAGAFVIAAIVATFAERRAVARFIRIVEMPDPWQAGRRMVARASRWFGALWPAGIAAIVTSFCAAREFGVDGWKSPSDFAWMNVHRPRVFAWASYIHWFDTARFDLLCLAIAAAVAASISFTLRRPRWLRSRWVGYLAGALAVCVFASAYVIGDVDWSYQGQWPHDTWLYPMVIGVGSLASLVCFASAAAQMRRGGRAP